MAKKLTVVIDGKKVTRRSDRPYRFAIVGTRSYDYDLSRAKLGGFLHSRATEERNYPYYLGGWKKFDDECFAKNGWTTRSEAEAAKMVVKQAEVEAFGSFEAYFADVIAKEVAKVEARKAEGEFDRAVVLGWSQSDRSAEKMVRHNQLHGWVKLHLVPVGGEYRNGEVFLNDRKLAL